MFKPFDLQNWKRKEVYEFFKTFDDPFFGICSYVDISHLYKFCKEENHSLFLAILYYATKTANEIEEFRLRIVEDEVLLFDKINCGTTVLHEDETFSFSYIEFQNSLTSFEKTGKSVVEKQRQSKVLDPRPNTFDVIHFSIIPWTSFTGLKHAKRFNQNDSVPKITFGKHFSDKGGIQLPVSLEVNHALMDGFHAGQFLNRLQDNFNQLG